MHRISFKNFMANHTSAKKSEGRAFDHENNSKSNQSKAKAVPDSNSIQKRLTLTVESPPPPRIFFAKKNLHGTLGLDSNATTTDIRTSHLRLVKVHHPDKNGHRADFEAVKTAHDVLNNPKKRSEHDAKGWNDQMDCVAGAEDSSKENN